MADRTSITVFFPTPLIFRYHLPLSSASGQMFLSFSNIRKTNANIVYTLYLPRGRLQVRRIFFFHFRPFIEMIDGFFQLRTSSC
jgi:hypothetical protein